MSSAPKAKSVAPKPAHPPFDKMIVAAIEFLNGGQTDDKARKIKSWSYQRIVAVVRKQNKLEESNSTKNSTKKGWKKAMNKGDIVRPKKYEEMGDKARGFAKLPDAKPDKPAIKPKAKKPAAKTAAPKKTTKKATTKKAATKKAVKSPGRKATAKKSITKTTPKTAAKKKGPKARTPNKKIGKKPTSKKTPAKKSPKSPKK